MTDRPSLVTLLALVKEEIGAVRKGDRNDTQGFNFRGVDAVVNAVSPAFIKHGITVVPDVREAVRATVEVGRDRTPMGHVSVTVAYTLYGPAGDSITGSAAGEAMDSGDKATPKAMSVAYRTFLLQALTLPTDEPDPDATSYHRTETRDLNEAVARVQRAWGALNNGQVEMSLLAADYASTHGGADIRQAGADDLEKYALTLEAQQ